MKAKRHTLANALRTAADQYEADAVVHSTGGPGGEWLMEPEARKRLVDQFQSQASKARLLADEIEQAHMIELED